MSPTPPPIHISDTDQVRRLVMERLVSQMDQVISRAEEFRIVRAEVSIQGIDGVSWLGAQRPLARGYWSDRDTDFELAGTGRADMVAGDRTVPFGEVLAAIQKRLATGQGNARYFGGFRFDDRGDHAPCWDAFKAHRFILPRFEVLRRDGETTFACNMRTDDDIVDVEVELDQLVFPSSSSDIDLPAPLDRTDRPEREEWLSLVDETLDRIRRGILQKLVLAREVTLTFTEPPAAPVLLKALKQRAHERFHFCFQPDPQSAFVGASPERLYRRDGRGLKTEALAGTRPRGGTPASDDALRADLKSSEKEQREHAFVVEGIRTALDPLVTGLHCDDVPSVLALTHAQHLSSRLGGTLKKDVADGDVLAALHPTAAVGGVPTDVAMATIAEREPFDRGWYAAPVGWVGRDAAQFVVGIRSALLDRERIHLFSGAGIVEGSDPSEEWDEMENKIGDFLCLFPSK